MNTNNLLRQAVLQAHDAVVITDKDRRIVFVNDAWTSMTGYSQEESLGKKPSELVQGSGTDIETIEDIRDAINTGEPIFTEILNYRKDGRPYWVELHIFPWNGHFISIQRDVTEKRKRQENLEEYKKFFDQAPIALIRTDLETGKFLMANEYAAKLLGFESAEDLMERGDSTKLYPSETRESLINYLKKRGSIEDYEIALTLSNGKKIWVSASFHLNCGGSCIEGSLKDISELVKLREQKLRNLKEISTELESKIANMSA